MLHSINLDMPREYIYEPWTAPLSIQKKAKCIIGKDYPKPGKWKSILRRHQLWLERISVPSNTLLVLQWLIMILQPKSVERGWEKLMPRIALIPTLPKGNLQTCRAENGLTVTKMPLTRPLPGNWRLVDLTDAQPISCGSITKWSCDNGGGLHQPSVVS